MNYLVYKHTSPSGKSYIGVTNDYNRRSSQHRYYDWCPLLKAAIDKYGWDAFTHEIVASGLTDVEAGLLETKLIVEHNTLAPNGYNITLGGGNRAHTPETRRRISEAKKGKPGRVIPEAERIKRAQSRSSTPPRPCSDEHKKVLAAKNARTYIVTSPDGTEMTITNLTQFCKENNLHYVTMAQVARGLHNQHKGWKCRPIASR